MNRFVTRLNTSVECGTQAEVLAETSRSPQLPSTVSPENIAESDCSEAANLHQDESNETDLDLNMEKPSQPTLNFPKSKTGRLFRSFQKSWYIGRSWLEYSVIRDKAFCFACRKFGLTSNAGGMGSEMAFIEGGFNRWTVALEKDRGLLKHEASKTHINSMKSWLEAQKRQQSGMRYYNCQWCKVTKYFYLSRLLK